MKRLLFAFLAVGLTLCAHGVTDEQKKSLACALNRLEPPALTLLADDWEAGYGKSAETEALRAFANALPERRQAALDALAARGDDTTAQKLLRDLRRVVLAHPVLRDMDILAVQYDYGKNARRQNSPATPSLSCYNMAEANRGISSRLIRISALTADTPKVETVFDSPNATISGVDLNWDANRICYVRKDPADANRLKLWTATLDGQAPHAVSPAGVDYDIADGCFLPNGDFIVTATAAEQGLPCESGRLAMTNTYRLAPKTGAMKRLTFDQDTNWAPTITEDGQVMYVRWEYCDLAHFFSRIVMTMRPDGTRQLAYFGSNGFWPNHYADPKPIPGQPGRFVSVVTGHHTPKSGKLALFDVTRAREEAAGCVQMIPGRGKPIPDRIEDRLYINEWPRYLSPFPLGPGENAKAAGKFFLTAMCAYWGDLWGIYLVDVFDNVIPLCAIEGSALSEPIRIERHAPPPLLPDQTRPGETTCTVHVADIYNGPGLAGVPRGTVKAIRVFAYHYAYNKSGSHEGVGTESSWDMKYVLGTVPVNPEGSVFFTAPAHVPLALQPLDAQGQAIQLMRSWLVGQPGEHVSCTGCHESANSIYNVPPMLDTPVAITPRPNQPGPAWSFMREVQPILNRRCIGCHNDQTSDTDVTLDGIYGKQSLRGRRPNLANLTPTVLPYRDGMRPGGAGAFTRSYHDLNPYVRRPGPESDNHLLNPGEYAANTSPLIQLLRKGHHGVTLTDDEWRTLYTWIDLNAPFWGTWTDFALNWANEFHRNWIGIRGPQMQLERMNQSRARRESWNKRYQVSNQDPIIEGDAYGFDKAKADLAKVAFQPPAAEPKRPTAPTLAGWPLKDVKPGKTVTLKLPGGDLAFREIPAGRFVMGDPQGYPDETPHIAEIKKPFLMAEVELPLRNLLAWKPDHYNGYTDWLGKDHDKPGTSLMKPDFPAVRLSWQEAQAYCDWLSKQTGRRFRLPSETEWEWAARAGTDTPLPWGNDDADFAPYANLADKALDKLPYQRQTLNYYLRDMRHDDGQTDLGPVGTHKPNAFGLKDMIGNAAEWTASAYRPYPASDDAPKPGEEVVCRGGAWDLLPRFARSAIRIPYPQWQRVHNVTLRLVCEE